MATEWKSHWMELDCNPCQSSKGANFGDKQLWRLKQNYWNSAGGLLITFFSPLVAMTVSSKPCEANSWSVKHMGKASTDVPPCPAFGMQGCRHPVSHRQH